MGVAALAVLAFYFWVGLKAWRCHLRTGSPLAAAAAFGLFTLMTNGLLQEEALFAPLALGSMLLLAGLVLGADAKARSTRTSTVDGPMSGGQKLAIAEQQDVAHELQAGATEMDAPRLPVGADPG